MGQVSKKHSLLKQVPDGDWQPRSCSPAGLALPGWAPAWAQQLLPYCLASQSALQGWAMHCSTWGHSGPMVVHGSLSSPGQMARTRQPDSAPIDLGCVCRLARASACLCYAV